MTRGGVCLYILLALAVLLGGCGGSGPTPATWNFLVYLDGDNDLEPFALEDMNEMERVGSTDEVNILVLADRIQGYDDSCGDWTDTRLYYITKDMDDSVIRSTQIYWKPAYTELDMSDPETLADFVAYCAANYPADRTVLVLWNHGSDVYPRVAGKAGASWTGLASGPQVTKGICWDWTSGSSPWQCLTTDEVARALAAAGGRIDLIDTDACLMQMLEVAYEWRDVTSYLAGSEETVPGPGNDYETLLRDLVTNPAMTVEQFARAIVDDYRDTYAGIADTTYSALRLGSDFNAFMDAFVEFAAALNAASDLGGVLTAWNHTTSFHGSVSGGNECKDLYLFAGELDAHSGDAAVRNAAAALRNSFAGTLFYHRETGSFAGRAFGLSILVPSAVEWPYYSAPDRYRSLQLPADTEWDEFILRFVAYTGV